MALDPSPQSLNPDYSHQLSCETIIRTLLPLLSDNLSFTKEKNDNKSLSKYDNFLIMKSHFQEKKSDLFIQNMSHNNSSFEEELSALNK